MAWQTHPTSDTAGLLPGSRLCLHGGALYAYTRRPREKQGVLRVYRATAKNPTPAWHDLATGPFAGDMSLTPLGDCIVVAGGRSRGFDKWEPVKLSDDVWVYNVAKGVAKTLGASFGRYCHTGVAAYAKGTRRCVAVFGGQLSPQKLRNDVVLIDPHQQACLEIPPSAFTGTPPCARGGHSAAASGSMMFIGGGATHGGAPCDDLFTCDLASLAWREVALGGQGPAAGAASLRHAVLAHDFGMEGCVGTGEKAAKTAKGRKGGRGAAASSSSASASPTGGTCRIFAVGAAGTTAVPVYGVGCPSGRAAPDAERATASPSLTTATSSSSTATPRGYHAPPPGAAKPRGNPKGRSEKPPENGIVQLVYVPPSGLLLHNRGAAAAHPTEAPADLSDADEGFFLAIAPHHAQQGCRIVAAPLPDGFTAISTARPPPPGLLAELWDAVASFLGPSGLVSLRATCRYLLGLASRDALWRSLLEASVASPDALQHAGWAASASGCLAGYARLHSARRNLASLASLQARHPGRPLSLKAAGLRAQSLAGAQMRVGGAPIASGSALRRLRALPGRVCFADSSDLIIYNVEEGGGAGGSAKPDGTASSRGVQVSSRRIPVGVCEFAFAPAVCSAAGKAQLRKKSSTLSATTSDAFANGRSTGFVDAHAASGEVAFLHSGRCVDVVDSITGGLVERTAKASSTGTAVKLGQDYVIMSDCSGATKMWKRATQRFVEDLPEHDGGARCILWDTESRLVPNNLITTVGDDGNIIRTDITEAKSYNRQLPPTWSSAQTVASLSPGVVLVSGHKGICVVDFRTEDIPLHMSGSGQSVTSILPVSETAFLSNGDAPEVCLWDLRKKGIVEAVEVPGSVGSLRGANFQEDSAFPDAVACCMQDVPVARVWPGVPSRAGELKEKPFFDLALPSPATSVAFDPTSLTLLTFAGVLRIDLATVRSDH